MKKYISLMLIITLLFGLVSCGKKTADDKLAPVKNSTISTPTEVIFYNDGMKTVSLDKELNLKIAQYIEAVFKDNDVKNKATNLAATTDLIDEIRRNEKAIELKFDSEIKFCDETVISSDGCTLFIAVTGKYSSYMFANNNWPDYWGGPRVGIEGLEQFFENVEFTPLTEEEKRWRSTISTPVVKVCGNGKFVFKEMEDLHEYQYTHKIAEHIESWFYHKEEIITVEVNESPVENVWKNEAYVELSFLEKGPTFYGEQIVSENSSKLIVPLTGEYAYYIFEGDYHEMSNIAIHTDGSGLEQFFEVVNFDNNN